MNYVGIDIHKVNKQGSEVTIDTAVQADNENWGQGANLDRLQASSPKAAITPNGAAEIERSCARFDRVRKHKAASRAH